MAIPTVCTYDVALADGGARRAGLSDLTGGTKLNDAEFPPDRVTMPTAEEHNQQSMQIAALNRVCPVLLAHVDFTAGSPHVVTFSSASSALALEGITVVDAGVGVTTLSWGAGVLPTPLVPAMASVVGAASGVATANALSSTSVQVTTKSMADAAADLPFVLMVF